jgi:hypothetical protein
MVGSNVRMVIVLALNVALNGTILWTDAFSFGDSWFVGRLLALTTVVTVGFLLSNLSHLRELPAISVTVICWILYMCCVGYATVSEFMHQYGFLLFLREAFLPSVAGPLVYLFFFIIARQDPQAINIVAVYFAVLTAINCVAFYALYQAGVYGEKPTAISAVYFPLLALPWVLSTRRTGWRWLVGAAIVATVFFSLKRTALIMIAAGAIAFTWASGASARRFRGLKTIGLCLMVAAGVFAFLRADRLQGERFVDRLASSFRDRGSGRLDIYLDVKDALFDSPWGRVLMGHGHGAAGRNVGVIAHNDLLEVPFDYGICGLAIYLFFHAALIRRSRRLVRAKSPYAPAFAVSYALFFFMSCTSNLVIFPHLFVILMSFWGFVEGVSCTGVPEAVWAPARHSFVGGRARAIGRSGGAVPWR